MSYSNTTAHSHPPAFRRLPGRAGLVVEAAACSVTRNVPARPSPAGGNSRRGDSRGWGTDSRAGEVKRTRYQGGKKRQKRPGGTRGHLKKGGRKPRGRRGPRNASGFRMGRGRRGAVCECVFAFEFFDFSFSIFWLFEFWVFCFLDFSSFGFFGFLVFRVFGFLGF